MKNNFELSGIKVSGIEIGTIKANVEYSLDEVQGIVKIGKEIINELPELVDKAVTAIGEGMEKASKYASPNPPQKDNDVQEQMYSALLQSVKIMEEICAEKGWNMEEELQKRAIIPEEEIEE